MVCLSKSIQYTIYVKTYFHANPSTLPIARYNDLRTVCSLTACPLMSLAYPRIVPKSRTLLSTQVETRVDTLIRGSLGSQTGKDKLSPEVNCFVSTVSVNCCASLDMSWTRTPLSTKSVSVSFTGVSTVACSVTGVVPRIPCLSTGMSNLSAALTNLVCIATDKSLKDCFGYRNHVNLPATGRRSTIRPASRLACLVRKLR